MHHLDFSEWLEARFLARAALVSALCVVCLWSVAPENVSRVDDAAAACAMTHGQGADGRAWLCGGRLDVNRATATALARVPRLSRRMARAIVADRVQRGCFATLGHLKRVHGIGPGRVRAWAPWLAAGPCREATDERQGLSAPP